MNIYIFQWKLYTISQPYTHIYIYICIHTYIDGILHALVGHKKKNYNSGMSFPCIFLALSRMFSSLLDHVYILHVYLYTHMYIHISIGVTYIQTLSTLVSLQTFDLGISHHRETLTFILLVLTLAFLHFFFFFSRGIYVYIFSVFCPPLSPSVFLFPSVPGAPL